MKVLIAVNYIGFINFLWSDIESFLARGYEVCVSGDNSLKETATLARIKEYGAAFVEIPVDGRSPASIKNLKAVISYSRLIRRERFELVVCHANMMGLLVRVAAVFPRMLHGVKLVYMNHGLPYNHTWTRRSRLVPELAERLLAPFCDGILCINSEDYERFGRFRCKRLMQVPGVGLDVGSYTGVSVDVQTKMKELGLPSGKTIVIAAGELSVIKNHKVIVQAIASLPDKSDYVFVVCGKILFETGSAEDLSVIGKEAGVDVRLLGFRRDLKEIYPCCHIGVMPSLREGMGMTGIEMLCAGLPVIGSDLQGIREYCVDGVTGYLVPDPSDPYGFAQAIKRLSDPTVRERMKDDCIRMASGFSVGRATSLRMEFYDSILSSKSAARP